MATLAFDSLRYARRLRDAGVPEPQAEVQAELMAEAFGFYADNIVTRDYLDAVVGASSSENKQRFDQVWQRFSQIDLRLDKIEQRLEKLDTLRIQVTLHSFMLGLIVLVQVVPQLQACFAG